MSQRLVIIDGKSVFYRGYYAMPNLSTKDGTPTGGVYGFAVMALEVVKKLKPDYVCVAWDKSKTNIRARVELYPEYKANRKPAPPDFYVQIPILRELLEALGWPLYEADDLEADDLMGAFAKQAGEKGVESYLITSDLDVLQLVNPHTHIYTLKKGFSNIELFNEASFREKYGIDAHQWIDVKALKGDSSDNIPGVAGVGEKTAIELISKYGTLDEVYAHLDELKPALKTKLEAGRDMAYLSKKLVTLICDADVQLDLDKARLSDGVTPEFVALLRKLEFKAILRQAEANLSEEEKAQAQPAHEKLAPALKAPLHPEDFAGNKPRVIALNPEATQMWVSSHPKYYELINLDPHAEEAAPSDELPLFAPPKKELTSADITLEARAAVKAVLAGAVVGHDLKHILRSLMAYEVDATATVAHDTRVGAFLINSLERSRELGDLLGYDLDVSDPGQVIAAIWHLYTKQTAELKDLPKVEKLARDVEFPGIPVLATMEHRGMLLDSEYLGEMSQKFATRIHEFEQKIYELAGQEFNISSPAQLGVILFDKLSLPTQGVKKGKTGYSTGAAELDKLRGLHPIIDLITKYREYTKLKSTYIDALPKLVDVNGRLHTTFNLDVAATGRLSSTNPNLQNIPTRTEIGQAIRSAFVPAPGNVFVSADYSQFELRLAAALASDEKMIEDFNQDIDIHVATAAEVYGVPLEEVKKDQRRDAKVVNFGVLYGMSPHGLSVATGMNVHEAKTFIDKYFELRAPVKKYMEDTAKKAMEDGFVETLFGRRRPTPDMKSSNFMVREAARRAAINMPIQGTEADLMKMAMLEVEKALDGLGEQILQIHDSILVETPKANAEKVSKLLKETMETIYTDLPVKLKVDIKTGLNWGEL